MSKIQTMWSALTELVCDALATAVARIMWPTCRLLFLLFLALAASFLLVQVVDPERAWSPAQDLLRIGEEKQRSEALDTLLARIAESPQLKQEIIRKLINERLTLEEALTALFKVYAWEFERTPHSGIEPLPLSREKVFEDLLHSVHWELRDNPSRACEVIQRLQRQWRSLSEGSKPALVAGGCSGGGAAHSVLLAKSKQRAALPMAESVACSTGCSTPFKLSTLEITAEEQGGSVNHSRPRTAGGVFMSRPFSYLVLCLVLSAFLAGPRSPALRPCHAAPQPVAAGRERLKDPCAAVRLRAALALAQAGDAEAVPVLIDLLADLSTEQRRPVEEVLRRLAVEWAPVLEFPSDDQVSRGIRRDAWAGWWRRTDGVLLLATLSKHTLTADKRERVLRLIGQLGDEEYAVRESAGQELAALGRIALPQLRGATRDPDLEVARRAAELINRIERQPSQQLPLAVPRLLAVRKPPGAVEALLAYLPDAEGNQRAEEVQQALGQLALCDGRPNPALVRALSDPRPAWRIAAAAALAAGGGREGRAAARKLLADEAPGVRLHAALALARAGEREAVLVLINLLAVLPDEETWQVEEVLSVLADDTSPQVSAGDKPEERKKRRDAWAAWWKANADRTDLARLNNLQQLGYTLVCDTAGSNRVFEIDRQGKQRWAIENVLDAVDVVVLTRQRILIAEYGANRITERDLQGQVLWEKKVVGKPCNVQRLANGNTWIALEGGALLEVDRTGKEVWTLPRVPGGVRAARRSPRGDIICLTQDERCLLLDATGKQLSCFATTGHGENSQGCIDLLTNGRVLITCSRIGKVMEFDREGKKRHEWDVPGVLTASALPNGHILAACQSEHRVCEIDRSGKIVWEYKNAGNPHRARRY